ncbi:MAG: hypothetical protein FWH04_05895 [Oscillospiraceae bacterium]|nr:hypothetical protein [Oscillospiraceae bacterium]
MANTSILEDIFETDTSKVLEEIYKSVNGLLGGGNQLFAMEFPARSINGRMYEYPTDDCFSTLTKPYTVQEEEFRLSDDLYDISPIVQGSNGEKLSTVYTTVLNNLVPKLDGLKAYEDDKGKLRKWLMETVSDVIDGEPVTASRMAVAKKLYSSFLKRRDEWNKAKSAAYDDFREGRRPGGLDGYSKWLSSEAVVHEEELNNFYNDAVVRGHYHEVLTYLGFLNVSSPAEALEGTKQKMRASLRRSLDASSDVYPVQFQPNDWFKALRPNISPKDLTMASESLMNEYKTKRKELSHLQGLLAEQNIIEIPPEEQEKLKNNIKRQEDLLAEAERKSIEAFGSSIRGAVKAAINIFKEYTDPIAKLNTALGIAKDGAKIAETAVINRNPNTPSFEQKRIFSILEDVSDQAVKGMINNFINEQEIVKSLKNLNEAKMAFAESKVKDMRIHRLRIEERIRSVQAELDFLTPLMTGTTAILASEEGAADAEKPLMTSDEEGGEDNNFMDVIIKRSKNEDFSSEASSSFAEQSSTKYSGWFVSHARESSKSGGSEEQKKNSKSASVEIGFRIKKVAINRGGWFNPNIFKLSNNFFRLADIRFSKGIVKEDVLDAKTPGAKNALVRYPSDGGGRELSYALPAFPTGFVIAKDITIRIQQDASFSEIDNKYMQESQVSSTGIFGFRSGNSSSSESSSQSTFFGAAKNFFYIRIPGPQILGWFLEFTPPDNAIPYEQLDMPESGD